MKVEVTNKEKTFEPIELKITIESEKELCSLWHRFNASQNAVDGSSGDKLVYSTQHDLELFEVLDKIIETTHYNLIK